MLINKTKIYTLMIACACIIGIYIFSVPFLLIFLSICVITSFLKKYKIIDLNLMLLLSIISYILLKLNVKVFNFIPQALYLYNINTNVLYWFEQGHLHAIRLLLAYPSIIICKFFDLSINFGFSIYIIILFQVMILLIINIMREMGIYQNVFYILTFLFCFLLANIMNGRIVFAFVGVTTLIYIDMLYRKEKINTIKLHIFTVIGFILSSVSSGTMTVISVYIAIETICRIKYIKDDFKRKKYLTSLLVMAIPVTIIVIPYLKDFLIKNIMYFNNKPEGIITILKHGLGQFFPIENIELYYLIILIGILIIFFNTIIFYKEIIKRKSIYISLWLFINLGLYGIFVGISTGTIALIPLFLVICKKIDHKYYFKFSWR